MYVPRIIEIECNAPKGNEPAISFDYRTDKHHTFYRVASPSRRPPALFSVNIEARKEALKVYQKRSFDSTAGAREIYFNPDADILYFGEGTCISQMMRIFSVNSVFHNLEIPRIAILSSAKRILCCQRWVGEQGIGEKFGIMETLHGFDIENFPTLRGCPGLKEVYFVTPSHLWEPTPGTIDPSSWGFRNPATDGITKGQRRLKAQLEMDIDRVENNIGLDNVGPNRWIGDNKPTFKFVSFAPLAVMQTPTTDEKVYDAFEIDDRQYRYLAGRRFDAIAAIKSKTGCDILFSLIEYRGQGREIGFSGRKVAVRMASLAVKAKLMKMRPASEKGK